MIGITFCEKDVHFDVHTVVTCSGTKQTSDRPSQMLPSTEAGNAMVLRQLLNVSFE